MTTPDWLKPGLYGVIAGAALAAIVGFSWGGWMTAGGAGKMAMGQAKTEVTAALVPVCLDLSSRDPDRAAKLVTIKAATPFKRGDAVMDAGWATIPGSDKPDRDLARACIDGLALDAA